MTTYNQDPTEHLDYQWDLATKVLAAGETIASYTATHDPGITVDQVSEANGVVTYWVTDGVVGQRYPVTLHVTTSEGRQYEHSDVFQIIDR